MYSLTICTIVNDEAFHDFSSSSQRKRGHQVKVLISQSFSNSTTEVSVNP